MPSNAFAATIQPQLGAHTIMKGTGKPTSQPRTRTCLRPHASASWPETRFERALMTPKLTMKDKTIVVEVMPNSSDPISGTTVRSIPTMPPTKALITMSSANCRQFSLSPSLTDEVACGADATSLTGSGRNRRQARVGGPDLRSFRRCRRNLGDHEAHKLGFVLDHERLVVLLLEADCRPWLTAQPATADGAGIRPGQHLDVIRKLLQGAHAAEQFLCAFFRAHGKFRAAEIADHEGMAGQDEPGLIRAGPVRHKNADVLGRVSRRVQHGCQDVSKRKDFSIPHASEWK